MKKLIMTLLVLITSQTSIAALLGQGLDAIPNTYGSSKDPYMWLAATTVSLPTMIILEEDTNLNEEESIAGLISGDEEVLEIYSQFFKIEISTLQDAIEVILEEDADITILNISMAIESIQ